MANIVFNNLCITGEDAIEIIQKLHEEGMAYWVPMPKYLLENFKLESLANNPSPLWREWALEHWGTKWDIYKDDRTYTVHDDNSAEIKFLTANSSIEPFCYFLSTVYPDLHIELWFQEEFDNKATKREWRNDG